MNLSESTRVAFLIAAATLGAGCMTKPNAASCVNTPTVCGSGTSCDHATGLCVAIGDAGVDADAQARPDGGPGVDAEDAGGDAADTSDDGSAPAPETTIAFRKPTGTAYTNGALAIELSLSGAAPIAVELLVDDQVVATIPAPYQYAWDSKGVAEGAHKLTARATTTAGVDVASDPVTVIVDRTPPAIVAKTPTSNQQGVSIYEDPITLAFSEPLLPASITDAAVALSAGANSIASKSTLAADGKSLTVAIVNVGALSLPATVTAATAATLTDLAGNALPLTSWSWSYPEWLDLGSPLMGASPRLAVGSDARPVLAAAAAVPQIAKNVRGAMWSLIGSPPNARSYPDQGAVAVALNQQDEPILVWAEPDANASMPVESVRAARWTGAGGWDTTYRQLDALPGNTSTVGVAVAVGASNQPVVAWIEEQENFARSVFVARWVPAPSSLWESPPGAVMSGRSNVSLALGNDQPIIGANNTTEWRMAKFVPLQTPLFDQAAYPTAPYAAYSDITTDKSGAPAIAISSGTTISVQSWTKAGGWADVVSPFTFAETVASNGVLLAFDHMGRPVVAWSSFIAGADQHVRIIVLRWNGASWDRAATIDRTGGGFPTSLVVDKFGRATVAWVVGVNASGNIAVQTTNR